MTAGGVVFIGRTDGAVQALDAVTGKVRWEYATGGRIMASPTLWENRLYVGSGDGHAYCLEAATGRPLWRFLAVPQRRRIMVYGALTETWPVDSGVLVTPVATDTKNAGRELACFAVGITSLDGVHVWAVDARTGRMVWHQGGDFAENPRNGQEVWHDEGDFADRAFREQRVAVYSAGGLTSDRRHLWMAGGAAVGRVCYDLCNGRMTPPDKGGGGGRNGVADIGIFADRYIYLGGCLLYRNPNERKENSPLGLLSLTGQGEAQYPESVIAYSLFSPAWDKDLMVIETKNPKNDHDSLICLDARKLLSLLDQVPHKPLGKVFWERPGPLPWDAAAQPGQPARPKRPKLWDWDPNRHAYGLILSANAVLVLSEAPWKVRLPAREDRSWSVTALDRTAGRRLWEVQLPGEPILNGLCLDRDGRAIVALADGSLVGVGE